MAALPGSSVPRRQLGRYLREAREEAGFSIEATARDMQWSRARQYRLESGHSALRTHDVAALCQLFGVAPEHTEALIGLSREGKAEGWWHAYGDAVPEWLELYVGMEAAAKRIRRFEPTLVPGILQTEQYATAVFQTRAGVTPDEIRTAVALRQHRQRLLTRVAPAAPALDVLIDEAVLYRPIADREAFRMQLAHLVNVRQVANVNVRVLPASVGPHAASAVGAFAVLDFPKIGARAVEPSTVYVEGLTGALYLEKPHEIAAYDSVWHQLERLALSAGATDDLLAQVIKESYDEA